MTLQFSAKKFLVKFKEKLQILQVNNMFLFIKNV